MHLNIHRFASLIIFLLFMGNAQLLPALDTLRVGVYETPPFVIYDESGKLEGVSAWLWDQMKEELEMPYEIIRYPLDQEPLKTILDDIEAGKLDISINPLTINRERDERIDFSYPYFIGNLTIAKRSEKGAGSYFKFADRLFTRRVISLTLTLIGMVVFFGALIWLIERRHRDHDSGIANIFTSFWWAAVTMTTVGYGDKVPMTHLGRFVAFVWMMLSLIIISIFVANITSSLTVEKMTTADMTVGDFRREKVGTVEASATQDYLDRTFFRNVAAFPELSVGLEALRNEEVDYFIYDEPWLRYALENDSEFASLELLPIRFDLELYAMPMRDNLDRELEDRISQILLRSRESADWELLLTEYQLVKH